MSYDEDLKRLLVKIDFYESLDSMKASIAPSESINQVLQRLDTEGWQVFVDNRFRWGVYVNGKIAAKNYGSLKIEPFENFKTTLADVVQYALFATQSRKFSSIKDFEEKAVKIAIELLGKIDEDLYEDVLIELRKVKESNTNKSFRDLKKKVESYRSALESAVHALATEWVAEKLTPGAMLSFKDGFSPSEDSIAFYWKVKKVVKLGSSTSVALEDTDYIITDLREIDSLNSWKINNDEAKDILKRVFVKA